MYSLWHIPSSTLLVASTLRDEVEQFVDRVLGDGCHIEDLMLQVVNDDELIGDQYLGPGINDALRTDDRPPEIAAGAY
jgi:hypothetical protein